MVQRAILWTLVGFAAGSIPFSLWLGRLALRRDIRDYGDGNPGAANAWRAGTWRVGVPAVLLDFLKGALPVSLACYRFGVAGWALVPVALAPVLGHAFSPFLRGHGGKAVATTFGVWTGLTLWEGPTVLGLSVALFGRLQTVDGWTVMVGMLSLLGWWLLRGITGPLLAVWCGNVAVLAWKHRRELQGPPQLRPWLQRLLQRLATLFSGRRDA